MQSEATSHVLLTRLQEPATAFWHVRLLPQLAFDVQETDEQLPVTALLQE